MIVTLLAAVAGVVLVLSSAKRHAAGERRRSAGVQERSGADWQWDAW
jgi:hypothetical protein